MIIIMSLERNAGGYDSEQKNIEKYTNLSTCYQFVPIAVETLVQ